MRNDVGMTTLTNFEPEVRNYHVHSPLVPIGANCLQVELANGLTRELTQVRISRSFVFGLLEDKLSWSLIRLNQVMALRFQTHTPDCSAEITWTRKAAGELLGLIPLPAPATICFQNDPRKKVSLVVLGATRGLVATNSYQLPMIPLQVISYLEISPSVINRTEFNS
ncbi:MAG: hypothetical protein F2552_04320 [Actinobacteria bacterium]|uniref:Unannotated protein n=1 Tax=freshwater metagenome TaxID=449393 RepID=A0A6J6DXX4_9ZZZZ|nr:hypothetical protein [Actinomycetota bacterium]